MATHLLMLLLFAAVVSTVFALLMRDSPRKRLRFALLSFAAFVLGALVAGWLMYPFPH